MDTEKLIMNNDGFQLIGFKDLTSSELDTVRYHVEITRHLQEIHNLYKMFCYNLESLLKNYTLMNSGNIFRGDELAISEMDYIAINAITNNIISSGRTLVESMECYIKETYSESTEVRVNYFKYFHDVYDESFAYRFLIRLRDYSQHGHLPVSLEGENYCIHLYHILHKSHFNHNAKIKKQISHAVEEIMSVYRTTPTLSLTLTLAEFTAQLLSVYKEFWSCIEANLVSSDAQFRRVINDHPENTVSVDSNIPPIFIYEVIDSMAHTVYVGDDTLKMHHDNFAEAVAAHREYTESWEDLRKNIITVRVTEDKQSIEIGSL